MKVRDVFAGQRGRHPQCPPVPASHEAGQGDRHRQAQRRDGLRYTGGIFRQPDIRRQEGAGDHLHCSVVYEGTSTVWSAYVPALPGLGVAGKTRGEVERLIRGGIVFRLEGLAEEGLPLSLTPGAWT